MQLIIVALTQVQYYFTRTFNWRIIKRITELEKYADCDMADMFHKMIDGLRSDDLLGGVSNYLGGLGIIKPPFDYLMTWACDHLMDN